MSQITVDEGMDVVLQDPQIPVFGLFCPAGLHQEPGQNVHDIGAGRILATECLYGVQARPVQELTYLSDAPFLKPLIRFKQKSRNPSGLDADSHSLLTIAEQGPQSAGLPARGGW